MRKKQNYWISVVFLVALILMMTGCHTVQDEEKDTSDAEIEAISCIEAIATGLVPIIAKSDISATKQFALYERSLFTAGNSDELAEKIAYWLEHPEEKAKMEKEYAKFAENFKIENSIKKIEEMFQEEINERTKKRK